MKLYLLVIVISAVLDIIANLLLKKSEGFKYKFWGISAIFCAILAFFLLSFSLEYIPLSIAYSTWGAIGIIGTCFGGWVLYKERLNKTGIAGIFIVILAVILLNT
ncbi:DMT family transporter [Campylobacter armoricus]|uniref:DMT family transporter n=1 Tax=Campylobacter armoricus TaxID=2505970 RepID=UPI001116FE08|nr:multidrug efflux SMR transporter [Campylobacter armoricus]